MPIKLKNTKINNQIPFGYKDGKMFEPTKVANGDACGCFCIECNEPLSAKANIENITYKVRPYFAHSTNRACSYAFESAVHLAAKQLIEQRLELYIPEKTVTLNVFDELGARHFRCKSIHTAGLAKFDSVRLEKYIAYKNPDLRMKPDLRALTLDGTEFIIEIAVTNPVDEQKIKKIQELAVPAIQIDLSKFKTFNFETLGKALFEPFEGTKWLFHPKEKHTKDLFSASLEPVLEKAKNEAKTQRFINLNRENAKKAESEKQAEIELKNKKTGEEKALRFKVKSPGEKLEKILHYLSIEERAVPWFLNKKVYGEESFVENRKIWQLGIFTKFIQQPNENSFNQKDVINWIGFSFNVAETFTNSKEVAVWNFLESLCDVGVLLHTGNQQFKVIKNDIHKLIAQNIQPPLNFAQIRLEELKWVSNWPEPLHTNQVAERYERKHGELDWSNIATLFPSAQDQTIEFWADYYSSRNLKFKKIVIEFLYDAGFITKR